jgi:hypothetical protein
MAPPAQAATRPRSASKSEIDHNKENVPPPIRKARYTPTHAHAKNRALRPREAVAAGEFVQKPVLVYNREPAQSRVYSLFERDLEVNQITYSSLPAIVGSNIFPDAVPALLTPIITEMCNREDIGEVFEFVPVNDLMDFKNLASRQKRELWRLDDVSAWDTMLSAFDKAALQEESFSPESLATFCREVLKVDFTIPVVVYNARGRTWVGEGPYRGTNEPVPPPVLLYATETGEKTHYNFLLPRSKKRKAEKSDSQQKKKKPRI